MCVCVSDGKGTVVWFMLDLWADFNVLFCLEAPVYDISGKKLVLKDVVSAEPKTTIIAWLRHYGCSLW